MSNLPIQQAYNTLSCYGFSDTTSSHRKNIKYSSNATPAYVPSQLFNQAILSTPVDKVIAFPAVTVELIRDLKSDIQNHVEMRIQLFALQLILIYNSNLVLHKSCSADLQVGKGNLSYSAAHSSTLPKILFKKKDGKNAVFFKGSFFYELQNSTVLLPKAVNSIDSQIDSYNGKLGVKKALRDRALPILNCVSDRTKEMDPKIGLELFIKELIDLSSRACRLRSKRKVEASKKQEIARLDQEMLILNCYLKVANSYSEKLRENDEVIKRLYFTPCEPQIDSRYYLEVQRRIYERRIYERLDLKEDPMLKVQRPISILPSKSQSENKEKIKSTVVGLKGMSKKYLDICHQSDLVQDVVKKYLKNIDKAIFSSDIKTLPNVKTFSSTPKHKLSKEIIEVWKVAKDVISKSQNVKDPHKMGLILLSLIRHLA